MCASYMLKVSSWHVLPGFNTSKAELTICSRCQDVLVSSGTRSYLCMQQIHTFCGYVVMNVTFDDVTCIPQGQADQVHLPDSLSLFA